MTADDLQVFIKATTQYFDTLSGSQPAEMGVPYVQDKKFEVLDYTGIIGISGANRGCIYFTASKAMLKDVGRLFLNGEEQPDEELADLIGEIANMISGNARRTFGENFQISVPIAIEGRPLNIKTLCSLPAFAIPIKWQDHEAFLVVCLN